MRYLRQIVFEKIGPKRQEILNKSKVVVVGLGALGSIAAELLARAGIGKIVLIDRDFVELSNLQRQSLYDEGDIDKPKVVVAKDKLSKINSYIDISSHFVDLEYDNVDILKSDMILDCTDNFYTRFVINDYAIKNNTPWIYAAVIGTTGTTFNIIPGGPCLSCIVKEPSTLLGTCDTEGIINTTPHAIASIQVTEAIKILTKHPFNKTLIHYDIWENKLLKLKVNKNPGCKACNRNFEYLSGSKYNNFVKLCGSSSYQFKVGNIDIKELSRKLSKLGEIKTTPYCLFFKDLVVFNNGRVIVKADSEVKAKSLFNKYLR